MSHGFPFTRLFAFDHGFGNLPGHWVHFHRLLADQARGHGLDVTIFGYQDLQPHLVGGLPARPLFRHSPATCFSPEIRENTRLRNEAFLADLEQLDAADFGREDLFVFTFVMNYELGGIMRFAQRFTRKSAPVFLVLLQFDNGLSVPADDDLDLPFIVRFDRALKKAFASGAPSDAALVGRLYRHALHEGSAWKSGAPVVFMAPSHGLEDLFTAVLKRQVFPYCMPGPRPDEMGAGVAAPPRAAERPPTVCFLGHSCIRKGLHLIPAIVEDTHRRFPSTQFEVQVNYNDDYPLKHVFEGLFEQEPPGVTFHRGHLDTDGFYTILRRADIVLCPYSRDVYLYMPSGLLREALALGKIVVLPAGTSLERQAASVDAATVSFAEQTPVAISRALDAALAHLPELKRKAEAAAHRWVDRHNPTRFMDQLLERAADAA